MESYSFAGKVLLLVCCIGFVELKPLTWDAETNPIVLVRLKRSPNRAFTFSGFNPSTGLSAFATGADFLPSFYQYAPAPPSPSFPQEARESYLPSAEGDSTYDYPPSIENPSPNSGDEDRKIPSQNLTPPPVETAPNTGYNANSNAIQGAKKPKKKPNRVNPAPIQEEEDDEENDGKSRSSSSASFNAWFPIVLGSYPRSSESYKDEASAPIKEKPGSTVIANSVSNGRSGVASSHAVLYGGESPVQSYRKGLIPN